MIRALELDLEELDDRDLAREDAALERREIRRVETPDSLLSKGARTSIPEPEEPCATC